MLRKTEYSLNQNLIIKHPIPTVGVVCSNPRRAERIAHDNLEHVVLLNEYQSAWSLDIYTGSYKGKSVFVAAIAVGSAGAAFAVQQLVTAGARYIIRYGSNDDPTLNMERMNEVIVVEQADNLYGLMQGSGAPKETWGEKLFASSDLIQAIKNKSVHLGLTPRSAICHHIEDYGAYAFPHSAGEYSQSIIDHLKSLEEQNSLLLHSRDMETAALFFRAKLDGFHAATVLQNVPKFAGSHQTYEGQQGSIAKQLESKFSELIFSTLTNFADNYLPDYRTYFQLDNKTIPSYLATLQPFQAMNSANLTIQEIGDGNLNNVFRIEGNGQNIIIKQALPYLRCAGPEHELSIRRMEYEINYMQIASEIISAHIPKIYHADNQGMMLLCMQDLRKHEVMRNGLLKGIRYPNFVAHITNYLTEMLYKTSRLYLTQKQHVELIKKFNDNELCKLTEDFVFTFPYMDHSTNIKKNNRDRFSPLFRTQAKSLLELFSTRTEALIHGDLHTGSIMLNQDETFVIDSEFAFMGPIGFDLGLLIANLLTAWVHHVIKNKNSEYQDWLLQTIENIINQFNFKFCSLWQKDQQTNSADLLQKDELEQYQSQYISKLFKETIGFAGLEICRRVCGLAGVKEIRDLNIEQEKIATEQLALKVGQKFVEDHSTFKNTETLITFLKTKKDEYLKTVINNQEEVDLAFDATRYLV